MAKTFLSFSFSTDDWEAIAEALADAIDECGDNDPKGVVMTEVWTRIKTHIEQCLA